ncbi:MAG TPA: hypothetical protein VMF05_01355 [Stellaceae bacterium]|nr:hypothetical protein [Stellaceae bacterium]
MQVMIRPLLAAMFLGAGIGVAAAQTQNGMSRTPIIPPPGTPGGNPNVRPR